MRKSKNVMYHKSFGKYGGNFGIWSSASFYDGIEDEEVLWDTKNCPIKNYVTGINTNKKLYKELKNEKLQNNSFWKFLKHLWHLALCKKC